MSVTATAKRRRRQAKQDKRAKRFKGRKMITRATSK